MYEEQMSNQEKKLEEFNEGLNLYRKEMEKIKQDNQKLAYNLNTEKESAENLLKEYNHLVDSYK